MMAENTGQRIAKPTPLAKVSTNSRCGLSAPVTEAANNSTATPATQNCVAMKYRRRSRMSASAPLGMPSRNTGAAAADCTSATMTGECVSEVISQAAATSFMPMQMLAVTQTIQSVRKVGIASGAQADAGSAGWAAGAAG